MTHQSRPEADQLNRWLEQTSSEPLPNLQIAPGDQEALLSSARPAFLFASHCFVVQAITNQGEDAVTISKLAELFL